MKFFWKMFFATMFVSVICFAFGGYVLINSNFKTLLNIQVENTCNLGDMVYYSLYSEVENQKQKLYSDEKELEFLKNISKTININNSNEKISFCLVSNDFKSVFSSLKKDFDKSFLSEANDNQKIYQIKTDEDEVFVQAIRPAILGNNKYYIETISNITTIFDNQMKQYSTLLKIMLGMLVFAGGLTFVISKFIMKQVVSLSKVTKDIAEGDLEKRVIVKGEDEFAQLSKNFNKMADKLESKFIELKNEAQKRDMFVGAFAHELKTPLTSIIGYSDMLRSKDMDKKRISLCANYIFTEGKRLEMLSMRLLDLIVLENSTLNLVSVQIKELFVEICSVVLASINKADIKLYCKLQPARIKMEPELMETVFINLIDNARKSIETSGEIFITGTLKDGNYVIEIKDNGKGIEEKELSKIKEAFYMVDKSRARKQGGAGLGLAICDKILKLHDFDIKYQSKINEGTKVSIIMKGAKDE